MEHMHRSLERMNMLLGRARMYLRRRADGLRYWQRERAYWRTQMQVWYRDRYGLALHPEQDDERHVPPRRLVVQIQPRARANPVAFLASGQRIVMLYLRELNDHGFDPCRFERILDFGVGFGRLLLHYYPLPAELHGCDVTERAVAFAKTRHGQRARLLRNELAPPLPYDDASFDYIYANSVFTHIQTDMLHAWIEELARIARPRACVIVSVFSASSYLRHLTEHEFDHVESGKGYMEFGSPHVRQRLLFATSRMHRLWWSPHFDVLEQRSHFKDQDHLVMRRRG
jgi:SAM-dependent methyltransferase